MSYKEEIAELWKEWKKSTEKYEEAIEDGYDVDADMWANDVETIHRQIHIHEQAAKADEYEAKAKAWDTMKKDFEDIADTPLGQQILFTMSTIKERVESGGTNA